MKTINGHKYSRESFEDYKLRVKIEVIDIHNKDYNFDIYTTQTIRLKVRIDLNTVKSDKVKVINIIHTATKEQDDLAIEAMNEWLNEV